MDTTCTCKTVDTGSLSPALQKAVFVNGVRVTAKSLAAAAGDFYTMVAALFDPDDPLIDLADLFGEDLHSTAEFVVKTRLMDGYIGDYMDHLHSGAEKALIHARPHKLGLPHLWVGLTLAQAIVDMTKASATI